MAGWLASGSDPRSHGRIDLRIGFVDDAEGRFATRDEQQGSTDVFGLGDLVFDAVPNAEAFERRLTIGAGGNRIDIGHGEAFVAEKRRQGETRLDGRRRGRVLRSDEDNAVAEEVDAGVGLDPASLVEVIHPPEVCRDEEIGRCAFLDLFCEGRASGEGEGDICAAGGLPCGSDLLGAFLETSGSEDRYGPRRLGKGRTTNGGYNKCRDGEQCRLQRTDHHGPPTRYILMNISIAKNKPAARGRRGVSEDAAQTLSWARLNRRSAEIVPLPPLRMVAADESVTPFSVSYMAV